MRRIVRIALCLLSILPTLCHAQVFSQESGEIAMCSGAFKYGVNLFMLANNEGAAKVMIAHAARADATFFAMNLENGKISGDKLQKHREVIKNVSVHLDSNPDDISELLSECVTVVTSKYQELSNSNTYLWGDDIYEFSKKIIDELSKLYSLQ